MKPGQDVDAAPTAVRMNSLSGLAPRISTRSLTTVFGTPLTWYRRTRSGYSLASTMIDVTFPLSTAIRFARLTAWGQCGHVGVTNTLSVTGASRPASIARLSSASPESPFDTIRIASSSDMNS